MAKSLFARALREEIPHLTATEARRLATVLLAQLSGELIEQGSVSLSSIGSLSLVKRQARTVKHPVTGQAVRVGPKLAVKFKPAAALLDRAQKSRPRRAA